MSKKKGVVRHPSTERLFRSAAARFMTLRRRHEVACDLMWSGMLASQFTQMELKLLAGYLSPHDHELLRSVQRASR